MDIVDNLLSDHGHLTLLARRIHRELPHFVRARRQSIRRLRALVSAYADYEHNVHQPRKTCLHNYLASSLPIHADRQDEPRGGHDWHELRDRLTQPMSRAARLDLRHDLVSLLCGNRARMQREEQALFNSARQHLSSTERHALAMRTVAQPGFSVG